MNSKTVGQEIIPFEGANLDLHVSLLKKTQAVYLKNVYNKLNAGKGVEAGNALAVTPFQSNTLYVQISLPAGTNRVVGYKEDVEENKGYVFFWNSELNHTIYEIDGNAGVCTIIAQKDYLPMSLDPDEYLCEGRIVIEKANRHNPVTDEQERLTFIIWTNSRDELNHLCVEDSKATNCFDPTLFPFFQNNDEDFEPVFNIRLGLQQPYECISWEKIALDESDGVKPNLINYQSLQFRLAQVDIWGRMSDHGPISDSFINFLGGSCVNAATASRCLKLKINAGPAIATKLLLLVREWNGNVKGESTTTDWYVFDTIEKYEDNGLRWFERPFRTALNYNSTTNQIEYTFCNDKDWEPVALALTNRNFNPMPERANSVFALNRRIGVANLPKGQEPLEKLELDKLKFTVTPPTVDPSCNNTLRTLVVWAYIWTPFDSVAVGLREHEGTICFGVADCYPGINPFDRGNNPFVYHQTLPDNQPGFIGHLAGTSNYCISQQYKMNRATFETTFMGLESADISFGRDDTYIALQRFEFKVIPGVYKFWIANHEKSPTDDYAKTSTRWWGQGDITNLGHIAIAGRELIVDLCNGDVEVFDNPIVIVDFSTLGSDEDCSNVNRADCVEGYLYEDQVNRLPVELAAVVPNRDCAAAAAYTDHNGFYFACSKSNGLHVELKGYQNCTPNITMATSDEAHDTTANLYRFNELYCYTGLTEYPVGDRYLIKGNIKLCEPDETGINGALVLLARSRFAYTQSDGSFTLIAHNIGNTSNARVDLLYYSQRGTCHLLACNDEGTCDYCFGTTSTTSPPCTGEERSLTLEDKRFAIQNFNKRGPHPGRRQAGVVLHDWLGRETFVQANDNHFFTVPSFQEIQAFAYCTINWDMTGIVFPRKYKRVSFWVTDVLNEEDYLVWAIDRVQFVDNTGYTNDVAPTAIRLYYEGLEEYNKQNNFSTNTTWQVIKEDGESPVVGDEIEFLANGDGTIFTKVIRALVTYDKEGRYLQIEYSEDLKDITENTLIRFVRPGRTSNQPWFYELCPLIKITDGVPDQVTGTLNLKDSYLLDRQIPVPVEVIKTHFDTDTQEEIETSAIENQLRSYVFPFEHYSPSDFWGDHAWNRGRVSVRNPYEKQMILRTAIMQSGDLASSGIINKLNFFDDKSDKFTLFDEQEWGAIQLGIPEISILLVICDHNNFMVLFDDNTVYVRDGQLTANSGNSFGRPDRKIGSRYGCQLPEINTVRKRNGVVTWIDGSEAGLIKHNFSTAEDISEEAGVRGWLTEKIKHIRNFNHERQTKKFLHATFDPKTDWYFLSDSIQLDPDSRFGALIAGTELNNQEKANVLKALAATWARTHVELSAWTGAGGPPAGVELGWHADMNYSRVHLDNTALQAILNTQFGSGIKWLRFPSAIADEYNWETGEAIGGSPFPSTLEQLLSICQACGYTPYFVLNVCTSTKADQLAMLAHWKTISGDDPKRLEFGNEVSVLGTIEHETFPTVADYVALCTEWTADIKALYPSCKCYAWGENKPWEPAWLPAVAAIPGIDGVTTHVGPHAADISTNGIVDLEKMDQLIDEELVSSGIAGIVNSIGVDITETNYNYDPDHLLLPAEAEKATLFLLQKLSAFLASSPGTKVINVRRLIGKEGAVNYNGTLGPTGRAVQQFLLAGYNEVQAYIDNNFQVILNLTNETFDEGPVTMPTDMEAYAAKISSVLAAYPKAKVIVIENEEFNPAYYTNTDPEDYITLLETAIPLVHGAGMKIANGGFLQNYMHTFIYRDYVARGMQAKADDYLDNNVPATYHSRIVKANDTAWEGVITIYEALLTAYKTLDLDYVNFHIYEPASEAGPVDEDITTASPDAIAAISDYLRYRTKKPVIINEVGAKNNNPALVQDIMQKCIDNDIKIVTWYSGDASWHFALTDEDGALRSSGEAFRDFIRTGKFINDFPEADVTIGETMMFDMELKKFMGATAFVPEYFGTLKADKAEKQLISFKDGEAWYHYSVTSGTHNNFFGVQTRPWLTFAFNAEKEVIKRWLYTEVYCKQVLLYAQQVLTEQGQESRIMPKWWDQFDKYFAANFKCAINSIEDTNLADTRNDNVITDGDLLKGLWLLVRLTPRTADLDKYFEFLKVISYFLDEKVEASQ